MAPKGILNKEPDNCGKPTKSPISVADNPIVTFNSFAVPPKRVTAANPVKKPNVAAINPRFGLPFK